MQKPDELDLLQRLVDADPAAPSDFCERYLPLLTADRRWVPAGVRDEHLIEDAAIEAALTFVQQPAAYNPARLPIMSYLRMAARGDLLNLLDRERRHSSRRAPLEAVERSPPPGNDEQAGSDLPDGVSRELLFRRLWEAIPDPVDRQAVQMMLDGVRATAEYARLYGLDGLPPAEQRHEVKRRKDRLDKVMKRLGTRLRGERGG
jgi:hypothetical protein